MRKEYSKFTNTTIWIFSAAFVASLPAIPARAQAIERPILTALQCQPLSSDNSDLCCIALNRQEFLTAAEIDQCPPLTTARIRTVIEEANSDTDQTAGTVPTDGPVGPGEEPGADPGIGDTAKANSGAGNAGETGSGEHSSTDADPGNSGGSNNSPDSPSGQN